MLSDNEIINSGAEVGGVAYFTLFLVMAVYLPSWIRFIARKVKKLRGKLWDL